jgi:hypothetical protein
MHCGEKTAFDQTYDLQDLKAYMEALPPLKLHELVMDMLWKDQTVRQSELYRYMLLLREKGVSLTALLHKPRFQKTAFEETGVNQ